MNSRKTNSLVVIENGLLSTYELDDKQVWEVGRPSLDNKPDIRLHSTTVSRKHGSFQNVDGVWFYLDKNGKNGTVYNGKHITTNRRGKMAPIILNNKDIFIFGGGEEAVINSKTIWAMFLERGFSDPWRVEDTKGMEKIAIMDGGDITRLEKPEKGLVVEKENGIVIYMGDVTYLIGDVVVVSA